MRAASIIFYVFFILSIPVGIENVMEKMNEDINPNRLQGYIIGTVLFSIVLLIFAVKLGQKASEKKKKRMEAEPEFFVED